MAIPTSGPVSLLDIKNEFGDIDPVSISEFYRNGGKVGNNNISVPTSGTIALSDFRGATNEFVVTLSATGNPYTYVNVKDLVDAQDPTVWTSGIPISIVIESGVVVGSLNASIAALTVPAGAAGPVSIENRGLIYGAVGQNNSTPSTRGGDALRLDGPVLLNNLGSIYAGGGGGNRGSNGSSGNCRECGNRSDYFPGQFNDTCARNGQACIRVIGPVCQGWRFRGVSRSGGTGGAGGTGQGFSSSAALSYIQPATGGSSGSSGQACGPGGNFSGTGGTDGLTGSAGFPWGEGNGGTAIVNSGTFLLPGSNPGDFIGEENR